MGPRSPVTAPVNRDVHTKSVSPVLLGSHMLCVFIGAQMGDQLRGFAASQLSVSALFANILGASSVCTVPCSSQPALHGSPLRKLPVGWEDAARGRDQRHTAWQT